MGAKYLGIVFTILLVLNMSAHARMYDAVMGRFLQEDPYPGHLLNPMTYNNNYIYALNNPSNRIDPSGEFSLKGVLQVATASLGGSVLFGSAGGSIGALLAVNLSNEFSAREKTTINILAISAASAFTGGAAGTAAGGATFGGVLAGAGAGLVAGAGTGAALGGTLSVAGGGSFKSGAIFGAKIGAVNGAVAGAIAPLGGYKGIYARTTGGVAPNYGFLAIGQDALIMGSIDAFNYHELDGQLNIIHKIAIAMVFGLPPFGPGF
jgi:RHS repeat-associated protein